MFFGFTQGNWLDSNHRLIFLAETIGSNCFMKLRCLKPGPSKISAAKLVSLFFASFDGRKTFQGVTKSGFEVSFSGPVSFETH